MTHDIPDTVIEDLKYQLTRSAPREAVGFIYDSGIVIELINEAPGIREFKVSSEQLRHSIPEADLPQLSYFYHTHPNTNAEPSQYDINFMTTMNEGMPHLKHIVVATGAMQIWEVRSTGPCILGHYQI